MASLPKERTDRTVGICLFVMNFSSPRPASQAAPANSMASRDFLIALAPLLKVLFCLLGLAVVTLALQSTVGFRVVAAVAIFLLSSVLIWKFPNIGVGSFFVFLVFLGGIRRWLIPDFGWSSYDVLLAIGPLIGILLITSLVMTKRLPTDTPLSRCVKYILLVMLLEVVNPLQGSLMVGLGGIIYYICPLLWFYMGRVYAKSEGTLKLFQLAVLVFATTGIYGMKQIFFGISASEKQWVELSGYTALKISDQTIRVFSTFASTQEYAATLACAVSICAALIIKKKTIFLLPLFILVPALLYTGTRGPIVAALFAICIQWAVNGRARATWLPRLGLGAAVGIVGIVWSLGSVRTQNMSQGQAELLKHQQEGLLDPSKSTAPGHALMVGEGIVSGIKQPLGVGLGATTLASGKLGGSGYGSSEIDLSNLFVSLGIIGGVLYTIIIFQVFKEVFTLWSRTHQTIYLVILGLLLTNVGQWLNGGLYSLCFLTWFAIGMTDKYYALHLAATAPDAPPEVKKLPFQKRKSPRAIRTRLRPAPRRSRLSQRAG